MRDIGPKYPCPCGRFVVLWNNGGEGDETACDCGRTHFLEAVMHHRVEEAILPPRPVSV